jgi:hypothetical protein
MRWLRAVGEQHCELGLGELGAHVGAVARVLEEVRVGVERHAGGRVSEDAADLGDVEADVDDQMAGERMAEVVEAHAVHRGVESGAGAAQPALRDVVMEERRAARGREDVVGAGRDAGAPLVLSQNDCELGEERDLAHRRARLRRHAMRRYAAAAARELVADVDHTGGKSMSSQLSASTSARRIPVKAPVASRPGTATDTNGEGARARPG